jgi:hypothetical protein
MGLRPNEVTIFSIDLILPAALGLAVTHLLIEMNTRIKRKDVPGE